MSYLSRTVDVCITGPGFSAGGYMLQVRLLKSVLLFSVGQYKYKIKKNRDPQTRYLNLMFVIYSFPKAHS